MFPRYYLLGLATATLLHVSMCEYKPFDCRRPGTTCKNDLGQKGACQMNGACSCPNKEFSGDDCGLKLSMVKSTADCSLNCGTGRCLQDGTADKCQCESTYYGTNCQQKRVDVTDCTEDSMQVNVNPFGDFKGKVYVEMLSGTDECVFKALPTATGGLQGYSLSLSLNEDLAVNPCASKLTKVGKRATYNIIVQYDGNYVAHTDQKHSVSCSDQGTVGLIGTVIQSSELNERDVSGLGGDIVEQTSLVVPINLKVTNQNDRAAVTSLVRVGDSLFLEVTMGVASAEYTDFYVESCTASNRDIRATTTTAEPLIEKAIIINRCPDPTSLDVIEGALRKDGQTVLIPFRGFKFERSDSVYMSCSVKMCTATNNAECEPIACDGSNIKTGFGRKKRQSIDADKVNVTGRLLVVTVGDDSLLQNFDSGNRHVEKEPCVEGVAFVTMAAIFGVVLVAALVVSLALCLRYSKSQNERKMAGFGKA